MQIVIDIPEDDYRFCKDGYSHLKIREHLLDTLDNRLILGVANGTPLLKGHGRLGDLDALETEMTNGIKAGNYEEGYEEYPHINSIDDCIDTVKYADTIIEADKEG